MRSPERCRDATGARSEGSGDRTAGRAREANTSQHPSRQQLRYIHDEEESRRDEARGGDFFNLVTCVNQTEGCFPQDRREEPVLVDVQIEGVHIAMEWIQELMWQ
ncbi:dna polymerase iii subunit alpha [Lasius niger]|uniref:Dna polymerase iii subunit alpha n=1 Tax=Lasius niger TaxID=67767 RepID=A0A0J7KE74_LASNI|nr:dna polymerase iii subunit alpha [Lasius niger]